LRLDAIDLDEPALNILEVDAVGCVVKQSGKQIPVV
jgi:hypothetical protein